MGTTVGLYYPFIHFRDEEWLKVAALYWPRMCRIVPPDYQTKDSDAVKRLIDELDFVSNVSPTPATTVVGKRFLTFLQKNEGDLRERYGLSDAEAWKPDPVTLQ